MSKRCPDCMDCGVLRAIKPGERDTICLKCVSRVHDDVVMPERANPAEILALMGLPKDMVTKVREHCEQKVDPTNKVGLSYVEETSVGALPTQPPGGFINFEVTAPRNFMGSEMPEDITGMILNGNPDATYSLEIKLASESRQRTYSGLPRDLMLIIAERFKDGWSGQRVAEWLDQLAHGKSVVTVAHGPRTDLHLSAFAGKPLPNGMTQFHIHPDKEDERYNLTVGIDGEKTQYFTAVHYHDVKSALMLMHYGGGTSKVLHHLEEVVTAEKVRQRDKGRDKVALQSLGLSEDEVNRASQEMAREIRNLSFATRDDVYKIIARGMVGLIVKKVLREFVQGPEGVQMLREQAAKDCLNAAVSTFDHNIEYDTDGRTRKHTISFTEVPPSREFIRNPFGRNRHLPGYDLYKGGIVRSQQVGIVGEHGPESLLPKSDRQSATQHQINVQVADARLGKSPTGRLYPHQCNIDYSNMELRIAAAIEAGEMTVADESHRINPNRKPAPIVRTPLLGSETRSIDPDYLKRLQAERDPEAFRREYEGTFLPEEPSDGRSD